LRKKTPKSKRQYVKNDTARVLASKFKGVVGGAMPEFIEPSFATLTNMPPNGERWVHEIKFDGYRLQIHKDHEHVKCYTRRGYDWTNRFKVLLRHRPEPAAPNQAMDIATRSMESTTCKPPRGQALSWNHIKLQAFTEINLRAQSSLLKLKLRMMGPMFQFLKFLPIHFLVKTEAHVDIRPLDATVTLFRYC
jgi:hypothetical protein